MVKYINNIASSDSKDHPKIGDIRTKIEDLTREVIEVLDEYLLLLDEMESLWSTQLRYIRQEYKSSKFQLTNSVIGYWWDFYIKCNFQWAG